MTDIEKINDLIYNSRNSIDKSNSLKYLIEAKNSAKALIKNGSFHGYIQLIEILSDISFLTNLPSERSKIREDCLSKGIVALNKHKDIIEIPLVLTDRLTDFIQDRNVTYSQSDNKKYYTIIKSHIDYLINKTGINNSAALLCRKSALLKNLSKYQPTGVLQRIMSDEAFHCALKAVKVNDNIWETHLALGLIHWHLLRFEKGDYNFIQRLERAQSSYLKSYSIKKTIPNILTLCNFYRDTHQPAPFIYFFNEFASIKPNRREYLNQADLLGRVAVQMWYGKYPPKIVEEKLHEADKLLEEAINAGFNDARMYLNLAFIKAALGEINVGIEIINSLYLNKDNKPWNKIAELILQLPPKNEDDLIRRGFALGIAESSSWNKIGTFAVTFINDYKLAISLYKEAIKLNPNNVIALTNLARSICNYSDQINDLNEADRLLSKAASLANPRFRWWRNVRDLVQKKISSIEPTKVIITAHNGKYNYTNLSDLYHIFLLLKASDNPQQKGFELQKIIDRLFIISFDNSTGSYFTTPPFGIKKQIDAGFFFFDKQNYRVETKWEKKLIDWTDIAVFSKRLDIPNISGLFISISGFSESAIKEVVNHNQKERQPILLMDGEELELFLQGSPTFDEAMRIKQSYFYKESNPYHKIKTIEQLI